MKKLLLVLYTLGISAFVQAQYGHIDHWETAIFTSEEWRYHVGTSAPDTGWKSVNYNHNSWAKGKGGLGFGYSNLKTTVPAATSLYIRKRFTIRDKAKLHAAVLSADWDDGFVAYLNGFEVARENIGTPWVEPKYNEYATYERKAQLVDNGRYSDFLIRKNQLNYAVQDGQNVLAIQIHNVSNISPDLAAFFNLFFGIEDTSSQFSPAPTWFEVPPVFADSSTLPIVKLTSPRLNDTAKIIGTMEIIYNGEGKKNSFYQAGKHYIGYVGIKYRGNSTLQFPKKSFRIETLDFGYEPQDVPLLGMPADNDWVLYAPYIDKTLLRNYVSYNIASRFQEWSPRTQLVEVFHNGYYIGVYILMEKIKRDDERVNCNRMTKIDTNARSITGGYMLKADWDNDTNYNAFTLKHKDTYRDFEYNTFQYYRPKTDSLHPKQKDYIKDFMWEFEDVFLSDTFDNKKTGYSQFMDLTSLADYMIMRELAKEIDGYRYSVYFYKNHEEDDNKIHMGPVWDFNLGYGNVDFSTSGAEDPRGWLWNLEKGRIFWFLRALDDKTFADLMDCRWRHVRKTTLTNEKIEKIIDDAIAHMDSAEYRNHYTWKTIGRYVWPNNFVGETYEEEVEYFKNWMWERIEWMDIYLPGTCQVPIAHVSEDETQEFSSSLFPNPGNGKFDIWSSSEMKSLRIYNMQGALIETIELNNQLSFRYALPSQSPGMYLIQVQLNNGALENHRYVYTR